MDDRALIAPLDRPRVTCLDASGLNRAMTRLDGPHVTLLGALGTPGLTAVMTGEGATDAEGCFADVEHVRAPRWRPGDLVVMDHWRAHHVAGVPSAMAAQDAHVRSWPPYAPDLSPIEPCGSQRQTDLRQANARTRETLETAMTDAWATLAVSDARRGFQPCGDA